MAAKTRSIRRASPAVVRRTTTSRNRAKLSTTVAAENFSFLEMLVSTGRTDSIAGAVDLTIDHFRRMENRRKLEHATAVYFDRLTQKAQAEEEKLAEELYFGIRGMDFDLEP